jgi:hypothetical protein
MTKYKEITSDWNYDISCMLTPLLVWDSENFRHLTFVAQIVCKCVLHQTSLRDYWSMQPVVETSC